MSISEKKEARNLFNYSGLDINNLRKILALQIPFIELSAREYRWRDVYGKNAVLNIERYMQVETVSIKKSEEKTEELLERFDKYFEPTLVKM